MMMHKVAFWSICVITLALILPNHAQSSIQDYLNAHNSARSLVGVANIVWDNTTAAYAQTYANQRIGDCSLVNSGGTYGENLAKGANGFSGTDAVNTWFAQKPYYSYSTNTCTPGKQCVHYTQLVWANSVGVGCARVQCTNTWWWVICSYSPKGNIPGEHPY